MDKFYTLCGTNIQIWFSSRIILLLHTGSQKTPQDTENTDLWSFIAGGFGTQLINQDISRKHETLSTGAPAYWWVKV